MSKRAKNKCHTFAELAKINETCLPTYADVMKHYHFIKISLSSSMKEPLFL